MIHPRGSMAKQAKSKAPPGASKSPAKRKRRSPEEAREQILAAAERRLAQGGPEALRLVEIAEDVGISHPAILHHFGSRDGLVSALEARAMTRLQDDLLAHVEATAGEGFERAFTTLREAGHGRLIAWQVLRNGSDANRDDRAMLKHLADGFHPVRVARAEGETPDYEDTVFWIRLAALSLFGEALIGPLLSDSARRDDAEETHRRFLTWLGALFDRST